MARGIPAEVIRYFQAIPLFHDASKRGLRAIVQATTEVEVASGRVMVREGDTGRELYVLVSGSARVSRNGRRLAELMPGDFFGELAFLSHAPRTATVTAAEDCRVLILGPRELGGLLSTEPSLAPAMLAAVARRVRESERSAIH